MPLEGENVVFDEKRGFHGDLAEVPFNDLADVVEALADYISAIENVGIRHIKWPGLYYPVPSVPRLAEFAR